jgi:hypothetical protein
MAVYAVYNVGGQDGRFFSNQSNLAAGTECAMTSIERRRGKLVGTSIG